MKIEILMSLLSLSRADEADALAMGTRSRRVFYTNDLKYRSFKNKKDHIWHREDLGDLTPLPVPGTMLETQKTYSG